MGRGSFANRGGGSGGGKGASKMMNFERMNATDFENAILKANDIDTLDMLAEAAGNSDNLNNQQAFQLYSMALAKAQLWQPTAGDMYNATNAQKNTVAKVISKADDATPKMQSDGTVTITYTNPNTGKKVVGYINKKGVVKFQ